MRFEEKIVELRKQKGLSQEELAEQLGVFRDRFPLDKLWHRNLAGSWCMHCLDFVQQGRK